MKRPISMSAARPSLRGPDPDFSYHNFSLVRVEFQANGAKACLKSKGQVHDVG